MTKTKYEPLDSFTDWLDQQVLVGDQVTVHYRHGDVPAAYSGEVVEIAVVVPAYGKGEVKAKIVPTGRYSYHPHHGWEMATDYFTGKQIRVGRPKANWIMLKNLTKSHVKVLDNGERCE